MSGKIGILIQARMSSSRLPGKSLLKIGEHPLIWYLVKRMQLSGLPVIVCTSDHSSDGVLADYLREQNVSVFRGSLENVLERYIKAAEAFEIENIVRVTGDNPLADVHYLNESLQLFDKYDYVDGIYKSGLIKGSGFELVTLSELRSVPSEQKKHKEHVTSWLREHLEESSKRIQLSPDEDNSYREGIILTCDHQEDLELLRHIFKHFDYRVDVPISDVVAFLNKNTHLKNLNRHLH